MEYRKLISFGKTSYVVSLPKGWIQQNKLKKGDLIYIDESGPNLVLSKKETNRRDLEKKKTIFIDGKSLHLINREVNSAYILNYRTIVLKGEEIRKKIKDFQTIFQKLIALEIMEQGYDTIIAKDFLNMEKVSAGELIKKMDVVARAMFREACTDFTEENYLNINERDTDVNRLYLLLYRSVLYGLDNPLRSIKNFNLNSIDLLNSLFTGFFIEGVADEVRRSMRYACKLKMDKKEIKKLEEFMIELYRFYLETMKSLYNKDTELALSLFHRKKELNEKLDLFEERNEEIPNYGKMVNRVRKLISLTHSLGRIVYQGYNYYDADLLGEKLQ